MKILMVCLGNICRSPLAEGILAHQAHKNNLDWEIDSAGTNDYHEDEQPDRRSIAIAKKYGIDISRQRARQLKLRDLDYFDKIYVMDSSNYQDVRRLARTDEQRAKIQLIMNEVEPNRNIGVPDPYYDGEEGFEVVFQMLQKACAKIIEHYQRSES